MSKHTPGPWILLDSESIEAVDFTTIAETARHAIRGVYEPDKSEKDNEAAYALDEANAHLIAAAPELLEACLHAIERLKKLDEYRKTDSSASIGNIKKAVAKAQGES